MMEAKKLYLSPLANILCFDPAASSLLWAVTGQNETLTQEALFGTTGPRIDISVSRPAE